MVRNPTMDMIDILKPHYYYNISAMMLAVLENNFNPMIEIFGESGAFKEIRKIIHYSRYLKNSNNVNNYPIGLGRECKILRPHNHIPAMFLAKIRQVPYMITDEQTTDYGVEWVKQFKTQEEIVTFYPKLLNYVESMV